MVTVLRNLRMSQEYFKPKFDGKIEISKDLSFSEVTTCDISTTLHEVFKATPHRIKFYTCQMRRLTTSHFARIMRAHRSNLKLRSTVIRNVEFSCFRRRILHVHNSSYWIRHMQNATFETDLTPVTIGILMAAIKSTFVSLLFRLLIIMSMLYFKYTGSISP
jgi:hypothetical protein